MYSSRDSEEQRVSLAWIVVLRKGLESWPGVAGPSRGTGNLRSIDQHASNP